MVSAGPGTGVRRERQALIAPGGRGEWAAALDSVRFSGCDEDAFVGLRALRGPHADRQQVDNHYGNQERTTKHAGVEGRSHTR
jgi:hypothetical protein